MSMNKTCPISNLRSEEFISKRRRTHEEEQYSWLFVRHRFPSDAATLCTLSGFSSAKTVRQFIDCARKSWSRAPENGAHFARCRKSDRPLATNKRFPGSRNICLTNPTLSPFRRVRDKSPQTPKN